MAAAENYPADLKYHSEHDWARIEGAEAVFGITWKAQDMLGERVFFQPPAVGAEIAKTVMFFAGPESGNITGETIAVDGGQSLGQGMFRHSPIPQRP